MFFEANNSKALHNRKHRRLVKVSTGSLDTLGFPLRGLRYIVLGCTMKYVLGLSAQRSRNNLCDPVHFLAMAGTFYVTSTFLLHQHRNDCYRDRFHIITFTNHPKLQLPLQSQIYVSKRRQKICPPDLHNFVPFICFDNSLKPFSN